MAVLTVVPEAVTVALRPDETILEAIARVVYARGGRLVVFP